jgi:hypothetical protein
VSEGGINISKCVASTADGNERSGRSKTHRSGRKRLRGETFIQTRPDSEPELSCGNGDEVI